MKSSTFLPESSRARDLTRALASSIYGRKFRGRLLYNYRTFDRAFGGEMPMRSLIRSNAHPQIYRLICSKVAELLFKLRSHEARGVRCEFSR